MQLLVDATRALTHLRSAEARLALFIVIGAVKALLPEDERRELSETLPLELRVLMLGPTSADEADAFGELELVDARSVEVICRLLARSASPGVQIWMSRYVAPRLARHDFGARSAMQSNGSDGFGLATLPAPENLLTVAA